MDKRVLLLAAGAALAMPALGSDIEIRRGESAPELGIGDQKGWPGRHRCNRVKLNRIAAYKRQRRANRLRRKALNK